MKLFRALRARTERGAVLVVAVPALAMAIAAASLGVDIGREAVDKRFDQKVADMAALDAARAVDAILGTTNQAGYNAAAQAEAVASAARNGFVVGENSRTITAVVGRLDPLTNAFSTPGTDAVQVVTRSHIDNLFLPGGWNPSATAVASIPSGQVVSTTTTTTPGATTTTTAYNPNSCPSPANINCPAIGGFSVGSTLASLDTNKSKLDPILKAMFGTSGNFSAVSYDGLASANVSIEKLRRQLVSLGYSMGTVDQLLHTNVQVTKLLQATAAALQEDGMNVAAAEVNDVLAASISNSLVVQLGDLISVASPNDEAMFSGSLNVWQLVFGSAEIVNGANFVSIPLTGVNLLGLSGVALSAYVIEPAQTAFGPIGTTADNAQVRIRVQVDVPLGGLLPVAHVTLNYTTAEAEAIMSSLACGAAPAIGVTATTSGVSVSGNATTTLGALNITGTVAPSSSTSLAYSYPTQFAPTFTRRVGQTDSGLSPFASLNVTGSGAAASLAPVLQTLLPTVLGTLDTALLPVIRPLMASLGLNIASADVGALGIYPSPTQCGNPVLK